jgi:hypothetical protein
MGRKSYNSSEEKFSDIIRLLKSLPEEKAPENFEFKLFTRIKNQNFEIKSEGKISSFPVWILAPVTAVVLAALVFLFVLDVNGGNARSAVRTEIPKLTKVVSQKARNSQNSIKAVLVPNPHYRVVVNQNDAIVKEKAPLPIDSRKAMNVDGYLPALKDLPARNKNLNRLVSQETSVRYFRFDGFIPIEQDLQTLEKLRARMDSLRKLYEMSLRAR